MGSCKKDAEISQGKQNIGVANTVPEDWKMLDENTIYISDRNILSSYATNSNLFLQTPYVFYNLDSNLKQIFGLVSGPNFDKLYNTVTIGNNFRLYFNSPTPDYLNISDNFNIANHSTASITLRDSLNNVYNRCKFSNFDNSDNFCLGCVIGPNNYKDTSSFYIKKYHVDNPTKYDAQNHEIFSILIAKQNHFDYQNSLFLINDVIYFDNYG